jgi:hypothetical protein
LKVTKINLQTVASTNDSQGVPFIVRNRQRLACQLNMIEWITLTWSRLYSYRFAKTQPLIPNTYEVATAEYADSIIYMQGTLAQVDPAYETNYPDPR